MSGPHRLVNPPGLAPAVGFSHAVVAVPGRTVYLAGQTAAGPDGVVAATGVVEQFDAALANLLAALAAADGRPEHLVSLQILVTSLPDYRAALQPLGDVYRRHLGRHYVATSLLGVGALFDPAALVELVAVAVVPDAGGGP